MTDSVFQPQSTGAMHLSRRLFVTATALVLVAPEAGWSAAKISEKDVAVPTPDGTADAVLFHPARGKGRWPAIRYPR